LLRVFFCCTPLFDRRWHLPSAAMYTTVNVMKLAIDGLFSHTVQKCSDRFDIRSPNINVVLAKVIEKFRRTYYWIEGLFPLESGTENISTEDPFPFEFWC
jgi:hypothetical protein